MERWTQGNETIYKGTPITRFPIMTTEEEEGVTNTLPSIVELLSSNDKNIIEEKLNQLHTDIAKIDESAECIKDKSNDTLSKIDRTLEACEDITRQLREAAKKVHPLVVLPPTSSLEVIGFFLVVSF